MNKLIILLITVLSFNCFSATELKGSPEELQKFLHPSENIITITREAEETVFKDVAVVSVVVTTEEDKLSLALKKNSELRAEISSVLTESGILLKNINNSKFSTSPDYGWFGDKPDSYKVSNVISIRITNEGGLESIAKVVDNNKEVTLLKTEYEHSQKEEYIDKVKNKALDNVLKEKDFYSKKLGIKLHTVSFRDNNSNPQNDIEVIEVMGFRGSMAKKSYSSVSKPSIKPSFEKVIYKAKVSVSFKVE
ncbi:SIMPL domain-containing protein [Paraglaciecola sp.]|uniref:SIMPL domain-containing protein n=1 Tax=Paraglaciecola sp. TaxID=1920173 RepID=UPI003EF145FC